MELIGEINTIDSREQRVILVDWGRVLAFGPDNVLIVPDDDMAISFQGISARKYRGRRGRYLTHLVIPLSISKVVTPLIRPLDDVRRSALAARAIRTTPAPSEAGQGVFDGVTPSTTVPLKVELENPPGTHGSSSSIRHPTRINKKCEPVYKDWQEGSGRPKRQR